MVAAIFVYAHKKLKILPTLPLPEYFRGAPNRKKNRELITKEELMKIIQLNDNELSKTQKVAKYCMLVELLTGIDYCDLKTLRSENLSRYDNSYDNKSVWMFKKNREKTGNEFTVFLVNEAKEALDKLKELTPGVGMLLLNLPSIEYSILQFKILAKMVGIKANVATKLLRHTFATNYLTNNGRIEDLQKILGHNDPNSTQIYGKVTEERLHNNISAMQISINPNNN